MNQYPRVRLSEIISQCTNAESITKTKAERYVTLSLYGKGARERIIKDGKYPVPFLGYRVSMGQFIYSRIDARNGAYAIIQPELDGCVVSKDFPIYDVNTERVLPRFLLRSVLCGSFIRQVKSSSFGATNRMRIKEEVFEAYSIPLPPIEEQTEIVNRLDRAESILEDRKSELELLNKLIKARFVEMFGDQETNPFGWQQSTIGETCTLKSGTSLSVEVENEGGSIPYVKVGDMNYPGNERYITSSSRFVTEETAGKGIFPVGSILFPKRGGAIGTNKKRMTRLPVCADLNVMGVTSNGYLIAEYLMAFFDMIDLGALDNGSSVPQINNKDIAPLQICVPPLKLQEQFAAFVSQVDKSKSVVQAALDKAQLLYDSLMQQYFG